jgi:pilus assembly protein CpaE
VFLGAKGGCGVTTLAANFALALAQESTGKTLLIDLGLPLGDAAINLGIKTEYSVSNALQQSDRLDARLLSTLVVKHNTGLSVLASPSEFSDKKLSPDSLDRLVSVAREAYDFVVADVGSRIDLLGTSLFDRSAIVYLIAQVGITEAICSSTRRRSLRRSRGPRSGGSPTTTPPRAAPAKPPRPWCSSTRPSHAPSARWP